MCCFVGLRKGCSFLYLFLLYVNNETFHSRLFSNCHRMPYTLEALQRGYGQIFEVLFWEIVADTEEVG